MKTLSVIMVLILSWSYGSAQELPQLLPSSPETAALLKFIDTPVNYNNGLPSIQIPLYTIQTRSGLSIPIYISYHASGIKVNEHATQVGLGWKLSIGGMISNQKYGDTDDLSGRIYPSFTGDFLSSLAQFNPITSGDFGDLYCASPENRELSHQYAMEVTGFAIENGIAKIGDALPDIFYYETPTSSGKFVYDSDFNAHPIPYAPLRIERNQDAIVSIFDPQGNTFHYDDISSYTTEPNLSYNSNANYYTEQFKLSTIETSLQETITYTYATETYSYLNPETFIDYTTIPGFGCQNRPYYDTPITTHYTNQRIENITFDKGRIEFYYSNQSGYGIENSTVRKDLPGGSALRRVVVYNNQDQIVEDFELQYSYFQSSTGVTSDPDAYRLKLDKVIQKGELPYEFTYNGNGSIPHRLSTQQDYWGYYGGSGGLLPGVRFEDIEIQGSDRSVDESLIQTGALEKIKYPTGGHTSFYFNEETYTHPQAENTIAKNNTAIFNTIGTHSFTLPEDTNDTWKIYFTNQCGTTAGGINDNYVIFYLYDQNGNVITQNSVGGVYEFSGTQYAGATCSVTLEGFPQNCNYGVYIEGESVTEVLVDKKTQLPGLRLDRMVATPGTGLPVTTTFDYKIPGNNRISKDIAIPIFHYIEERSSSSVVNHQAGGSTTTCQYIVRKGSPAYSTQSSYEHVTERRAGNGYTKYHFMPSFSGTDNTNVLNIAIENIESGKLLSKEVYSASNKLLTKEAHSYETDYSVNQASSDYNPASPSALTLGFSFNNIGSWIENCFNPSPNTGVLKYLLDYNIFNINGGWVKNKRSINTRYFYNENDVLTGENVTTTDYFYDNPVHAQVSRMETTTSSEEQIITHTYYPDDVASTGSLNGENLSLEAFQAIVSMRKEGSEHKFGIPIQTETVRDGSKTTQRTNFKTWENQITLPAVVETAKNDDNLENRIEYHAYDEEGNPLEVSQAEGSHSIYIWGYNDQYPIAKIDNASYTAMPGAVSTLINQIKSASNTEDTLTEENNLRLQLEALQSHSYFQDSQMSYYTYDPLIGMTSSTDPSGYTMTYQYDTFNRLQFVKDADGNLVSENQYNYKN